MTYFLIAGEASGDLHASNLMKQIAEHDSEAHFVGLGGDLMRAAGAHLYQDYREMAFMGVVAVLRNLGKVRRNFAIAREALLAERPDVLVLIDYPSFNLKMAAFCRKHLPATRIIYYIPPKVWAWKSWRTKKICTLSDEVLGIFPFEPAFYRERGFACRYVGNPTVEAVRRDTTPLPDSERHDIIAILPGSRKGEISHCLPRMIAAAERVNEAAGQRYRIVITGAPGIEPDYYRRFAGDREVLFGETYRLLSSARAAIVNSGTATLEAALLRCPQVPVYHIALGWLAHLRPLVFPSPHFTLPNIILQREVVREKIAYRFTVEEVSGELERLLHDHNYRAAQLADYDEIARTLGTQSAAETAARIITRQ